MGSVVHDFDRAGRDLFPSEQRLDTLVPEQLHEGERIRARNGNKQSIRRNKAVGDQTDPFEFFEVLLDLAIQRPGLGIPGPVDSLGQTCT
jgi:hypothetical protein